MHMTGNGLEEIQGSKCYKQTDTTTVRNYLLFYTGDDNNEFHVVCQMINKNLTQSLKENQINMSEYSRQKSK